MADVVDRSGAVVAPCEERTTCVLCGHGSLRSALTVERVPVHMGCTADGVEVDAFADQVWVTCEHCDCLQLRFLPPLSLVYRAQHNAAVGGVWSRHHAALGEVIASRAPRHVVEVGGSTGSLAFAYADAHDVERWTVVEPNPTFTPRPPVELVEAFVEDAGDVVGSADALVHSHVLEHLYHPRELLRTMHAQAPVGLDHVLSVPDLDAVLANSGANALNFEHTYYFGVQQLLWLLADTGWELDSLRRFERHSLHVVTAAGATDTGAGGAPPDASHGLRAFAGFVEASRADARALADRASSFDGPVHLFGGHVFSQFLLTCGFPESRAVGALDNDPAKQGLRLYGTDLVVQAPASLAGAGRCAVVVRAAHYTPEITAQLRSISPDIEVW